jgi:hypothetical protein
MGWTGQDSWKSASDVIDQYLTEIREDCKILDYETTGNKSRLWIAVERKGKSFVICVLVEYQSGSWMYKDMTEDVGPAFYDCPMRILHITKGLENTYSVDWRAMVRRHHGV